ncbi:vacuolar sorting protein, putative [Ichthyophthirius multifiliis]|uniref:Vacuolar sorting protein, putative n=1 Tax=Ichthyophthirius multifiliis TaxID=5932 RepID=G0R6A2_ICHMU|nr:vacuolar sorting protein, putative [Ichthyophthirius multifiliis]EGR26999.1 vacuolar sorting protein, putative [Ichthyophthirius multifiliis]|eukprot:XP_004023883.1 vacuolar sorting protein, putative [Ichthyophthirius multifiliis]
MKILKNVYFFFIYIYNNTKYQQLKTFKDNFLILLSFSNQDFFLTIFDILNGFIAYKQNFKSVQSIIPSQNCIHIMHMTSKGEKKITKLTEIENTYKIQYFFNRFLYDIAYKFVKNQSQDQNLLAEICRLHADNIYQKGDYQLAIQKYIETIGFIEPSYVVRKFLDVSQIEYLIKYLEALHQKKKNDKHYTALLLNCYVKQKLIDKLDTFLKQNQYDSELFDIDLAIKVCRESKNNDLALTLADQNNLSEQYLDILMESLNENNTLKAIDYIRSKVDLQEKTKFLLTFGQKMMKLCPEKTLELIQNMVLLSAIGSQQYLLQEDLQNNIPLNDLSVLEYFGLEEKSYQEIPLVTFRQADEFFHVFLGTKDQYLENYLEFLTSKVEKLQNEKVIFHKLFEFYLEKNNQSEEYVNKILMILKNNKNDKKYDQNYLLVLFKMKKFAPGIIFLYQIMGLKEDLLNFYINNNEGDKIIEMCKKEINEPNLWIQALKYFTQDEIFKNKQDEVEIKLKEILENIANQSSLSPLLVLSILQDSKNVQFGTIKSYFKKKLEEDYKIIQKDQEIINKNIKEVQKQKQEYEQIKTQARIVTNKKCSECDTELNNPKIHFMCGHSFHLGCLRSDTQQKGCDKCSLEFKNVIERKEQFNQQSKDHKAFYENLTQQNNKFEVIAGFLGKGLFAQYNGGNN